MLTLFLEFGESTSDVEALPIGIAALMSKSGIVIFPLSYILIYIAESVVRLCLLKCMQA